MCYRTSTIDETGKKIEATFESSSIFNWHGCLSLCLIPPPPLVQGSRVQILPSFVWDHAVRPDPRAPGRPEKVLPAHRPCVSHCAAAWARTGPSAGACRAGGRHRGRGGGWGGGPVMLHHKQPGTRSSAEASASNLCDCALWLCITSGPSTWFMPNTWLK